MTRREDNTNHRDENQGYDDQQHLGDNTSHESEEIDSHRLMEAVDAALNASEEIAQYTGQPRPYPADLMGSALQPPCLAPFTFHEIEEASRFLLRMDEVSPSIRAKKPAA